MNEPKGKMVSNYLQDIDIVVCISFNMPSAVIEAVTHGTRSVFWDYGNMRFCQPELYQWGENKVIFSDLDEMLSRLKFYKNTLKNILISVIGQNIWMILILFVTIVEENESGLIFVGY